VSGEWDPTPPAPTGLHYVELRATLCRANRIRATLRPNFANPCGSRARLPGGLLSSEFEREGVDLGEIAEHRHHGRVELGAGVPGDLVDSELDR
jgi:hypothetical protein